MCRRFTTETRCEESECILGAWNKKNIQIEGERESDINREKLRELERKTKGRNKHVQGKTKKQRKNTIERNAKTIQKEKRKI